MTNKLMGKQVTSFADFHHALVPEQYGGRNRHRAIIAALNKWLTTDLWHLNQSSGALCPNDAKSCFNHITHPTAILALEHMRLPQNAVKSAFLTLQCLNGKWGL